MGGMDRETVFGTLKATGSSDPDVLYVQKEALLAPYKNLKRLAILAAVVGAFFTITMLLALFGVPLMLGAWWLWRFQAKNTAAVEAGYTEYLSSVRV
jgi:hypothetical protein